MNEYEDFKRQCDLEVGRMGLNRELKDVSRKWISEANALKYSYHFEWMGRPIIQYPQDILAMQELIWSVKPDLIIETGIAHGGSLILSASMLALLDLADAIENKSTFQPEGSKRLVVGIDIEIREHNKEAIEKHPMASRIKMIEGSSISSEVIDEVVRIAQPYNRVMVFLDSNHTEDHVFSELQAYSPLVTIGSYCVVFDTVIEDLPSNSFPNRPWSHGNNPKTAARNFLSSNPNFIVDKHIDNKLLLSVAPEGYLRRIS